MGDNDVFKLEIGNLKQGQKDIKTHVEGLETKIVEMDKHFTVELSKIKTKAETKATIYATVISVASLVINIIYTSMQ